VEVWSIVAHLEVIQGPSQGLIEVKKGRTLIGRSVDCDVVCGDPAASREHAVITCVNGDYYLDDNKSRNGTYVNNVRLTTQWLLKDNDAIKICTTVMTFIANLHARKRINALFGKLSNERVRSIDVLNAGFSLEDIVELRGQLEKCHVRLDSVDTLAFQRMLEDPESEARRVLTKGFHRLVILDATKGRDAPGGFNLETFNRYLFGRLREVFALKSTAESYHDEDVSQCLKDEDRSLFCFLNEQEIPTRDLRRLRGFTQGRHQTLFVCSCARDLVSEEQRYEEGDDWEYDSDMSRATLD
jgi:pSer/pThr/pTyr-binding forkhead associated (FHA) protein